VHAPLTHAWFVHGSGLPHDPLAWQVSTALPQHCVAPVGLHAPSWHTALKPLLSVPAQISPGCKDWVPPIRLVETIHSAPGHEPPPLADVAVIGQVNSLQLQDPVHENRPGTSTVLSVMVIPNVEPVPPSRAENPGGQGALKQPALRI
jgi:hypothetical protein